MPTVPQWFTGPAGSFACVLTPQTINSSGVLSATTPVATLTFNLERVGYSFQNSTENIVPLDLQQMNEVVLESGVNITLVEILKKTGENMLASAAINGASAYVKVVITRGAQAFTFYGVVKSYEEGIEKGKSVGTLVLGPCGIAGAYA